MSAESVLAWLAEHAPDLKLIEHSRSTATVAEAAEVIGVEPGRIAKTLALRVGDEIMLVVARNMSKTTHTVWERSRVFRFANSAGAKRTSSDVILLRYTPASGQ